MAELVGLAASIIQIAGAGVKLSTTLYNFVGSATRADQEITDIAGDVEITANALDSVGKVFEDEDAPSVVSKKAIEHANSLIKRCEAVFGEIHEVIDKRRKLSKDGKKSLSALGKLAWPMKEQKIELLRRRLESLKNSLILLFHVLQLANGQARGKLEKNELEREREKIRELHQRQQDSIRNLEALEAKFRKATIDDEETLSGSTTVSRTPTFNLMAIPSLLIEKIEKKPDSQLRKKPVIDISPLTDDSEMSDSEGTVTDEEAEHLTLDELAQCAKHVQKLLKRISTLQETFETTKAARRLPKTRVHKLYRRFCQKFESQVTPRASVTIQDSLRPLPAFVPPSNPEGQREPVYGALSRNFSMPDVLKKEHKPHLSLSAPPLPRRGDDPHPRPKTPSMIQSYSQGMISGSSTRPVPGGSQSSSGGNSPIFTTPESESILSAGNGKPPKTAVEIPSALNHVQDLDFLTLRHQSMPNHRDNKLAVLEGEEYQRRRSSEAPITDKVHKAAKRARKVHKGAKRARGVPNSPEFESESTRTKDKEGTNKVSRVSVSNRTNITNSGSGGDIQLRVEASAPLSLQFNGDMEGRILQINTAKDGMAEIGMGSQKEPREKSSRPLNERPDREYRRDGTRHVLRRRRAIIYNEAEPGSQNVAPKPLTPSDESVRHIPRTSSVSPLSRKPRQHRQITETEDCTDPSCAKCIFSRGHTMRYNNTGRNAPSHSMVDRSSRENGSQRRPRPTSYHITSPNNYLNRPPLSSSNYHLSGPPLSYVPPLVTQGESYNRIPSARYAQPPQSVRQARLAQSESSESESSIEDEVEDRYSRSSRALIPPPPVTKTPVQRRPSLRRAATTQVYNADRMSQSQTLPERPLVTSQMITEMQHEALQAQPEALRRGDEKPERRRQAAASISGTEPAMSLHSTSPAMGQGRATQQAAASKAPGFNFRIGASAEQSAQFPAENLKQTNLLGYQSSSLVMWSGSKDRKQMDDLPSDADQKLRSPNATAGMHQASGSHEAQQYQPSSERGSKERDGEVEPMDIGLPVASMTSKEMSVGEMVVEDDEKDWLYKEMMEGLAGNDSSEESVEENEVTLSKSLDMVNMREDLERSPAMPPVYEKPLFINPKQFDRILKRRLTRQRIEQDDIATDLKKDIMEVDAHPSIDLDNVGTMAIKSSNSSMGPSESAEVAGHITKATQMYSPRVDIQTNPFQTADFQQELANFSADSHNLTSLPNEQWLEVRSIQGGDNGWESINMESHRKNFDLNSHSSNLIFNPSQALHIRTNSDSSQLQTSGHTFSKYEEIHFPMNSPQLGAENSLELVQSNHSVALSHTDTHSHSHSENCCHDILYSEQDYANYISQSVSPPNAVVRPYVDLTIQPLTSSTPYQPPISEGAVFDNSSRDFAASPSSPRRKRARDETTEKSSSAENTLLATPISKSEGDIVAATERKAEIVTKRAKLRDLKEQRKERMEAFPLAKEERRTETYIDGVYSSRRSRTGYRALSPMTDWDSVKISPTDDWRVIESKRAKRNDMIRHRRELRKAEKEIMKATPIVKVSSSVDNLFDRTTAASGPYGPSSSQGIEQHYLHEEGQSLTDTNSFTEVSRNVAPVQNKPKIPHLAQGPYVPSSVTAAQTQSTLPTAPPSPPPLRSPIPVPWNLQRIALLNPQRFAEVHEIAGLPSTSDSDAYPHREIATKIPGDERSYVTSHGVDTSEGNEEYAIDEYGNFILDDTGHRVPAYQQQHPTVDVPDYSGQGYGSEWAGMRHHHPTKLNDMLDEGERNRTSLTHSARLDMIVAEHANREPPERDDSRDPRTKRVRTAALTMASSISRPALSRHPTAQSAFEPARNAHVIVENSKSRPPSSTRGYDKINNAEERSQRRVIQNSKMYDEEPDQNSRMCKQNLVVEPSARRRQTNPDARHSKVYANSSAAIGETRRPEEADRQAQEESKQIRFELAREERAQEWSEARVVMRDSRGAEESEGARRRKQKESTGNKKQPRSAEVNPTRVPRPPNRNTVSKRHHSRRPSLTRAQAQERDLLLAETEVQMVREREDGNTIMDDEVDKERQKREVALFLSTYNVDAESEKALMRPRFTNKPPVVLNGPIDDPNFSISAPKWEFSGLDGNTVMAEDPGVEKDIVDLLLEEWTVVPMY